MASERTPLFDLRPSFVIAACCLPLFTFGVVVSTAFGFADVFFAACVFAAVAVLLLRPHIEPSGASLSHETLPHTLQSEPPTS